MKNYNSIDIGKFVACIGIIAIHANPIYASYHIADSVVAFMASLCVLFFFVKEWGANIRRYNKLFHILFGPYRNRSIGCFL